MQPAPKPAEIASCSRARGILRNLIKTGSFHFTVHKIYKMRSHSTLVACLGCSLQEGFKEPMSLAEAFFVCSANRIRLFRNPDQFFL